MNPAGVHLFDDADEYRVHCEKCSKIRNACWRPRDRINRVLFMSLRIFRTMEEIF